MSGGEAQLSDIRPQMQAFYGDLPLKLELAVPTEVS
jgi:hypothetical protein